MRTTRTVSQLGVLDAVDLVADSDAPVVRASKFLATCWARFVGESIDTRGNALLERLIEAS
jgi:hypothetical protein